MCESNSSKLFEASIETKGFVISLNVETFPNQKLKKSLTVPGYSASGSFSTCAYHCSVLLRDLEAYAIGFHFISACCRRSTAPIPYEEESARQVCQH